VLCLPLIDDRFWSWLPVTQPPLDPPSSVYRTVVYGLVGVVAALSIRPARNMLSPSQMMNYSFNPIHIVNTYGAFGSITRTRYEIVFEGTDDAAVTPETRWREYEFKGKPGDPTRRPPQVAPYHLRLDWLMWFAAMSPAPRDQWLLTLATRLLEGDREVASLLRTTPFPDRPPRFLRARYYRYRFTTPEERTASGAWWKRDLAGEFLPPVSLEMLRRP